MKIDLDDCDQVRNFAITEAGGFDRPKYFCGGRFQTNHPNIFVHINKEGNLIKIEVNKKGGTRYFLSVPRKIWWEQK
jgi:hypothetical protein